MVLSISLFNNSKRFILRTKGELKVTHFEQNIEYFSEHRNVNVHYLYSLHEDFCTSENIINIET